MAINHIQSDLRIVTDHALGFVSAAEGFVFLAGLMGGYVYARLWRKTNFQEMTRRCTQRAIAIYRWHVLAFVAVFAAFILFGFHQGVLPPNAPTAFVNHPQLSFLAGFLLLNQPALFDILPMYCVFLLAAPWCLRACQKGHYTSLVGASFASWLLVNLFVPQSSFEYGPIHAGAFNLAAWQVLFVTGLCFGHFWAGRGASPSSVSSSHVLRTPSRVVLVSLIGIAAVLFCVRRGFLDVGLPTALLDVLTNKNNLAPLRLFNAAVLFYLIYLLLSRFPSVLSWRPLVWLGQCSLAVFTTHILATYVIQAFPATFAETTPGRWLGTAFVIATLFAGAAFQTFFSKSTHPKNSLRPAPAHPPLRTRQSVQRRTNVRHEQPAFGTPDPVHHRS